MYIKNQCIPIADWLKKAWIQESNHQQEVLGSPRGMLHKALPPLHILVRRIPEPPPRCHGHKDLCMIVQGDALKFWFDHPISRGPLECAQEQVEDSWGATPGSKRR